MDLILLWTDPAVEQYVERLDHIGGFNPEAARRLRRRVDLSLRHIARFPDLGRWVPEFGPGFYREILVKPLRILYEFQGDRIVATCVHRQEEAIGPDSFNLDTEG
jgi:plasmid stabilization system protein ParE